MVKWKKKIAMIDTAAAAAAQANPGTSFIFSLGFCPDLEAIIKER